MTATTGSVAMNENDEGYTDIIFKRREDGKWEFEAAEHDIIDIMDSVRIRRESRMKQRYAQMAKNGGLKKTNLKSLVRIRLQITNGDGTVSMFGEPPGRSRPVLLPPTIPS